MRDQSTFLLTAVTLAILIGWVVTAPYILSGRTSEPKIHLGQRGLVATDPRVNESTPAYQAD